MTFTPQLGMILIGMACLLIGWGIGFLDSNKRTEKKVQAAEANAEIAIKDAENKIAAANQKLAQTAQVTVQDDAGLLRLKNNSGYLTLEIDGAPINNALEPDGKKRLIELLTIIRPYLEGNPPPQAASAPAAPRPAAVMPAPVQQPIISSPTQTPIFMEEAAPKSAVKSGDKLAMASLSIVAQIDAVLQERLINTALAKRGIRVYESPEGGVQVEVGLQKFETIDDVSDPEIKAFIRAAVAEWEKKFTPGM